MRLDYAIEVEHHYIAFEMDIHCTLLVFHCALQPRSTDYTHFTLVTSEASTNISHLS